MMSLCCIKESLCTFILGGLAFVILKFIYSYFTSEKSFYSLKDKRVVITGGSSGIGLSLAKLGYKYGAHVTIIGRNSDKLKLAEEEICSQKSSIVGHIETLSVDVCSDYESLKFSLHEKIGKTDILINCAGGAVSRTFVDMNPSEIEGQMNLNYLGSAKISKLFLPSMLEAKTESNIVFVSSMAGQVGLYGFTTYSASKFALRGLAESLRMEVAHRGVHVTLAFPPDTRTPGYNVEQIGKPHTTKRISEAAGLLEPDYVASRIWTSVLRNQFFSSVGLDGWFLTQLTFGMCLPGSVSEVLSLVVLSPLIRLVALGYGLWIRHIVRTTTDVI